MTQATEINETIKRYTALLVCGRAGGDERRPDLFVINFYYRAAEGFKPEWLGLPRCDWSAGADFGIHSGHWAKQ